MKASIKWMLCIKLLAVTCFFALTTTASAQKVIIDNVIKAKARGSGSIIEKDVVKGYYSLYELDKAGKGKRNYMLVMYDQDLNKVAEDKFVADKNILIREATYNGVTLLLKFGDIFGGKKSEYTFKLYNLQAENIATFTETVESGYDYAVSDPRDNESGENKLVIPLESGFVDYFYMQKGLSKTRYGMRFITNDGKVAWTYRSPEKPKDYELCNHLSIGPNVIISQITKKPNLFSRDLEEYLVGTDLATGKRLFENKIEDPKQAVMALSADATPESCRLYGLYFDKDAKTAKDPSKGLFCFEVGYDGKVINRKYVSWEKDVSAFLPVNAKGKIKDIGFLYFHKFQRTADGKTFGIAEQFRREASALGIASKVLNVSGGGRSNVSVVKAVIEDLYMFEFDNAFELKGVTVYDKTRTPVELPSGYEFVGPRLMGYALDMWGSFDYAFTTNNPENTEFYVGYLDRQKMEKGKRDYIFGTVSYADGKLSTDKTVVGSEATWFTVQPAKSGYFVVIEYFRKKKTMEFRMEKYN